MKYDDGITIRVWRSQEDPIDDVLFLMNQSKRSKISSEWLQNKLSWGRGGIATIAYDGTVPIGLVLFGSAPYLEFSRASNVLLALYNYVSNDYRGRGIYNRLLFELNEACVSESFDLALIYPNSMARPGVRNNGWTALPPMQAYVHLPLYWSFKAPAKRLRNLMQSRSAEFVPIQTQGIDDRDLEKLASRPERSQSLHFARSNAALHFRFNALRGPGYQAIHGKDASAIVRVGRRGMVSEVQFMATAPNQIGVKDWNELLRLVKKSYKPDMVSRIESNGQSNLVAVLASGFMKLREVTIPFWKAFRERPSPNDPKLSGIDIHTW